jgi:hypothetical protein
MSISSDDSYETVCNANVSIGERDEQGFLVESPLGAQQLTHEEIRRRDRNVSRRQTQSRYNARIGEVSGDDNDDDLLVPLQANPQVQPVQSAINVQPVQPANVHMVPDNNMISAPKVDRHRQAPGAQREGRGHGLRVTVRV